MKINHRVIDVFFGGVIAALVAVVFSEIVIPKVNHRPAVADNVSVQGNVFGNTVTVLVRNDSDEILDFKSVQITLKKDLSIMGAFPEVTNVYSEHEVETQWASDDILEINANILQVVKPGDRDRFSLTVSGIKDKRLHIVSGSISDFRDNIFEVKFE